MHHSPGFRSLKIAFYTRGTAFNGNSIETKGLGGSESAMLYMARELARLGHEVNVFCNCDRTGTYHQVAYRNFEDLLSYCDSRQQDICVFSRFYEPLPRVNAAVRILWLHDVASIKYYTEGLPVIDSYINRYFLISKWQQQGFTNTYQIDRNKLYLTRNGVDLTLFDQSPARNQNKLIYINTPFRGLDVLIGILPHIRQFNPDIELHVYTGMSLYGDQYSDWEEQLRGLYDRARETPGLQLCEPIPKADLARELMSAYLSVYPSHFRECCSIASLETQAAGTPMITSDLGGLRDTVINGKTGILIPIDDTELLSRSRNYQQRFVNQTIRLLGNTGDWETLSRNARQLMIDNYSWSGIAREWEAEFFNILESRPRKKIISRANGQDLQDIATRFLRNGALTQALDTYEQICDLNPFSAQAWHMRGAISGMLGNFSDTVLYCEKALALSPEAAAVHANYATALAELERHGDALEAFRKVIRLNPADVVSMNNMGELYQKLGIDSEAENCFRKAMELDPEFQDSLKNLALIHSWQERHKEAREFARKLLGLDGNSAAAQYVIGVAAISEGNTDEATEFLSRALGIDPTLCEKLYALGRKLEFNNLDSDAVLVFRLLAETGKDLEASMRLARIEARRGNRKQAIAHLKTAVTIDPGCATAMDRLGQLYFAEGKYENALIWYRRAVKASPENADYCNNLGTAYEQLGRNEEARRYFLMSVRIDPKMVIAYCNLAHLESSRGRHAESLDYYDHALRINENSTIALAGKATVLERTGEYQGAFEAIKPVIDSGSYGMKTALAYARLSPKFGHENDAIEILNSFAEKTSIRHNDRVQIHFALGRLLDRTHDYDKAFSHYRTANKLCNQTFDRKAQQQLADSVISVFNRDFMDSLPSSSNQEAGAIFVVGMPRSGTTLVEQILATHSEVHGCGELTCILEIVLSLQTDLGRGLPFPCEFGSVTQEILDKHSYTYTKYLHTRANGGEKYFTDKMPSNFMFLGLIELLLPNARVVHCTRDPMDTCLSCYFQNFARGQYFSHDQSDLAFYYNIYRKMMAHWKNNLKLPLLDVKYEELITRQEDISREIIEFAGLDWHPDCLEFYKSKRQISTASYEQVRNPVYTSSMGKWKKYRKHLSVLEKELGDQHT